MDSVTVVENERRPGQIPMRACEECKRKKTKCDMRRPECSNCTRHGASCLFPTSRKRPVRKKNANSNKKDKNAKLNRLLQILDDGDDEVVRNLLSISRQRHERGPSASSPATSSAESNSNNSTGEQQVVNIYPLDGLIDRSVSPRNIISPGTHLQLHDGFDNAFMDSWYRDGYQNNMEHGGSSFQDFDFDGMDLLGGVNRPSPATMSDIRNGTGEKSIQNSPVNLPQALPTPPIPEDEEQLFSLAVSTSTAKKLIDTYFEKIQGFLPLFHRPKFYAQYVEKDSTSKRYTRLSLETALLLNSMFALSARFSDIPELSEVDPKLRGNVFADHARSLYERARRGRGADRPSFEYLQGCLTYTYYLFTTSPCTFSWVMVGVCCRLAYDMGLHEIDQKLIYDEAQCQNPEGWVEREGMRRLWWSLWELDSFASTISCRPCNIDQNRVYVLLPVSDEAWFANEMVNSASLGADLTTVWQSLEESENQDERAWFIVSEALMMYAHEAVQSRSISHQRIKELQNAIACFGLLLPSTFHLDLGYLRFDKLSFAKSHWILGTILTLQEAKIHAETLDAKFSSGDGSSPSTPGTIDMMIDSHQRRRQHLEDVARVVRVSSPEYLPLASPFFACMLVGASGTNVYKISRQQTVDDAYTTGVTKMLILALKHFARYWNISALLLDLVDVLQQSEPSSTINRKEHELRTQFAYLTPRSLRNSNILKSTN